MAFSSSTYLFLLVVTVLVLLPTPAAAFGAGNIASLSRVEGHNWRHGDIEDVLAGIAFLKGRKFSKMAIKRVYFGNWLRDYSQAVDVGTLKGVQAETIRVLVWVLSFMAFGYATAEFEVTAERLGCYRPEEHIDSPLGYADGLDARQYDQRLRGPVSPQEVAVDPRTGMKNYISNEEGGWATSSGYVKYSLARSIHYGRMYTHSSEKGKEEHLCEALRCLGQALHCLEDFGAHTNYCELALRELGYNNVFPHTGVATQINLHGRNVYPLVTGTFGGVDFLHSVIGEATDHVTQSELDEMNSTLGDANSSGKRSSGGSSDSDASALTSLLEKIPGTSDLCSEAFRLQRQSEQQAAMNSSHGTRGFDDPYSSSRGYEGGSHTRGPSYPGQPSQSFQAPPGSVGGPPGPDIPGTNLDPAQIIPKIYPILEFRDKVVRTISNVISKIPGLEKLLDTISERVTLFIFGLLAPYIQPLIKAASKQLKEGSSTVVDASAKQQYGVWNDPHSSDPTHSMLSKDHFSNVLNSPAGEVAAEIVKYVAPRIVYAWENTGVPVEEVGNDVVRVFHHPALRDRHNEAHNNMFRVVEQWARKRHPFDIDSILSSQSVKDGKNHTGGGGNPHLSSGGGHSHAPSHSHQSGSTHSHSQQQGSSSSSDPLSSFASTLSSALPFKLPTSQLGGAFNLLSSSREVDPNDGGGVSSRPTSSSHVPFDPYPTHTASSVPYTGGNYAAGGGGGGGAAAYGGGYGASQAYYDHAAAPVAYADGYQTSYQAGYYDGPQQQQGYQGYQGQQQPPSGGGWFDRRD